MSYDVSVYDGDTELFWENYTSNVSWMWAECLALPDRPAFDSNGQPQTCQRLIDGKWVTEPYKTWGLRLLDEAPCSEAAGVLWRAVEVMRTKGDEYRPKEPENGWGDYDGALRFLTNIATAAAAYPHGVIHVHA